MNRVDPVERSRYYHAIASLTSTFFGAATAARGFTENSGNTMAETHAFRTGLSTSRNALIIILCAVAISPFASADVVIPTGLNPGDKYYLAFVTQGTRNATSTAISDYNNFVTSEAARAGSITEFYGLRWFAIASTAIVDARNNAIIDAGVPIYLLNGTTKVADGFADLWDGTLDAPLNLDQFGAFGPTRAWAGTGQDGLRIAGLELGQSSARVGVVGESDGNWITGAGTTVTTTTYSFYAVSEQLVVAVPEPCSCALLTAGAAVLAVRRKGTRSRQRRSSLSRSK